MYREDIVESQYARMILHGLQVKSTVVDGVPGKLLPKCWAVPIFEGVPDKVREQRRAKGKLARNARKRQRRNR